jgi:hypothetical protein
METEEREWVTPGYTALGENLPRSARANRPQKPRQLHSR